MGSHQKFYATAAAERDELRRKAEASVGSWMEQEENECWERVDTRRRKRG